MMGFLDSLFGGGGGGGMDAGGFLSSLGSGLSNNSNALTQLGSGLLSGGTWKQGLANAGQGWQQGHQQDRWQNIQNNTSAAAKSLLAGSNLAPGIQQAILANPELAQQFIGAQLKPHTYGFQTMPDGTLIRTDELAGTASPAYQAAPKMVFNTVGNNLVASDPTSAQSRIVASGGGGRMATDAEKQAMGITAPGPYYLDQNNKPEAVGPQQQLSPGYRWTDASNTAQEAIPGSNAEESQTKATQSQAQADSYFNRAANSNAIIGKSGGDVGTSRLHGLSNWFGSTPVIGNGGQSEASQKYEQAKLEFVNATLRNESGAKIDQSEFDKADKEYFPQPGDSAAVMQQKARARQDVVNGLKVSKMGYRDAKAPGTRNGGLSDPAGIR